MNGNMLSDGLLWYDGSKDDLLCKAEKAVRYFRAKYGVDPRRCVMHPVQPHPEVTSAEGVKVSTDARVQPGHFWLEF